MKSLRGRSFLNKSLAWFVLIIVIQACSYDLPTLPGTATAQMPGPTNIFPNTEYPSQVGLADIPMQVGYGVRGPFYEIYFTDPFNKAAWKEEGGPDVPLAAAIDQARISVDVAAYSFSLYSIRAALIDAHQRGVEVRMVMESDNMFDSAPQALMDAGIPIIGDRREGLMHDKFVVIDRSEVWMGSMNFTTSGTYEDNNNLVRIRSTKVAEDYTVEFEEMFKDDFFGPDAIAATPNPRVTVDGVPLEVYFSPDDHVAQRIVELLRAAQQSIYFMAYSFTANDFGEILRQKARDGLIVSGVMEGSQVKSNQGTEFTPLTAAGLPVYLDGNVGQMHHKVFIIDEKIVITGSYNFSASAERINDENVVIFFDPQIAAQYMAEFRRVEAEAQK
jgi:phosphatidylserine/phosphatidylglycerophosphate/cardiolipin synthase-like enzyme